MKRLPAAVDDHLSTIKSTKSSTRAGALQSADN